MTGATQGPLAGRHAVVTGGSRGIGLAIAQALADAGASVTLMARDAARLDSAAAELRAIATARRVLAVTVDVADEASVNAAFVVARDANGAIDILVNNAGVAESAPFAKTSVEQFERLIDINLKGVWLCTQAFAAGLPKETAADAPWRHVVNVASTAALKAFSSSGVAGAPEPSGRAGAPEAFGT